jgi:ribose transport system ATP-binding protein
VPDSSTIASGVGDADALLREVLPGSVVVELAAVSKTFPGQVALDDVSIRLRAGAVHALLGQNGSGKSTLIKILAGYHSPDSGARGTVAGHPFPFGDGKRAYDAGLRFIHQELDLIDELTVAENLAMTRGYQGRFWVSRRRETKAAARALEVLDLRLDPDTRLGDLRPVDKTLVAICRALSEDEDRARVRVLVLDEPTASLPPHEIEVLFEAIRRTTSRGVAVLYVSHNLEEVAEISTEVTVLRDGRLVAHEDAALSAKELVHLILGHELETWLRGKPPTEFTVEPVVLETANLAGMVVRDVSLAVRRGEIVGIAGLLGSGREELPYLLAGAIRPISGRICVGGQPMPKLTPQSASASGIAFVPPDRKAQAAILDMTARENLTLSRIPAYGAVRALFKYRERREALQVMQAAGVFPANPEKLLKTFSGGNQQKIVIARALRSGPQVLVVSEPVQGVDVGNKALIFRQLVDRARTGLSVVVASSDPEDLVALCDRVLVLHHGRIAAELEGDEISHHEIVHRILQSDD